jgi:hypothetical protein
MERRLPGGPATNRLEVVAYDAPDEFAIRATDGPTPFLYHYRFESHGHQTRVQLEAQVELNGFPALAAPFARQAVKRGVDKNLATLAAILDRSSESAAQGIEMRPRTAPST